MAHRDNVIQVMKERDKMPVSSANWVEDPVCKTKVDSHSARHALFRPDQTYYFCSKECEETFVSPEFQRKKSA